MDSSVPDWSEVIPQKFAFDDAVVVEGLPPSILIFGKILPKILKNGALK